MIITKTPHRISFFGGGSDYPQWVNDSSNYGEIISTTINKHLYITLKNLNPFFGTKYRIIYSAVENVNSISQIKHRAIRGALGHYALSNAEIHCASDIPAKSGMGSSSSFSVGLIKAINEYKNKKISKKQLAIESINFEHNLLNENVGSQDQISASYGGFNIIRINKKRFKVTKIEKNNFSKKLNQNLVLIYTGQTRIAHNIAKSFVDTISTKKSKIITKILDHVNIAKKIIEKNSPDDFGYLLNETWNEKRKLSPIISNDVIDKIYNRGIKNGALGGKLLGAGGGGFILFYVDQNKKTRFLEKFKNYINIPFEFSSEGSKVIFKNED